VPAEFARLCTTGSPHSHSRGTMKEAHRAEARMSFAARVASMAAGATAPQPIVLPEPKTASGHVRPSTEIAGRADRAGADSSRGSHHFGQRAADGLPAHRRLLGGPAPGLRRFGVALPFPAPFLGLARGPG